MGPIALRHSRLKYNDSFQRTTDEQWLLNIVRLRYAVSPAFIDVPTITSQYEISGFVGANAGRQGFFSLINDFGDGQLNFRDSPTFSYSPRSENELSKSLLQLISPDLLISINTGSDLETLLTMAVKSINYVDNASVATAVTPSVPGHNEAFRHVVSILDKLQDTGQIEVDAEWPRTAAVAVKYPITRSTSTTRRAVEGRDDATPALALPEAPTRPARVRYCCAATGGRLPRRCATPH